MEAVPRLPMLCFELKTNPQKNAEFGPDLINLIRLYYQEDPSNYTNEIQALEKLRQQAMKPSKDVEGVALLKRYFCQLYFLQKRFPMLKDGPTNNDISWKTLLSSSSRKVLDYRLEFTITLYNIGALHTQLGAADDRTTSDGLKLACTHFQCAAWAFQYLEEINSMKYRADFDPGFFQFLIPTCLAQAQECIAEKSMTDNRKSSTSALIAAQICEYYGQALNALTHGKQEELPIFDVNIKNSHVWINYVKYKKAYYECVSNLFLGMQAEEDEKMGERVAYFEASAEKLKLAVQHAKCIELPQLYKGLDEAMTFTRDVVEGKRKNAVSENEFIYHEEVPPRDSLPKVKGASLVKCIGFDFGDPEISGPDIFAKLISLKTHQLASVYSEEKAKLLRSVSSSVEEKDAELVSFMQSLKLDYLHPNDDLNNLPEELVERCAACEAKPDLIQDLNEAMDKLTQNQYEVDGLMKEVMKMIEDEEKAEAEFQLIMGTSRQPTIVSTDLKCEANRYAEALKKATDSNESLRNAISAHVNNLQILTLPLEELDQHLPKVSFDFAPDEEPIVRELRRLVGKVEEMRNQRALLMLKFRDGLKNDDITEQIILSDEDKGFINMVAKEISKHQNVVSLIEQNLKAQVNILNALTNTYAAYAPIRRSINETLQQRSAQVNALIESFDVSDDVLKKAAKGLEFYNKLENNVRKLLDRLKGTCKVHEDNRKLMYAKTKKSQPQTHTSLPYNPYYNSSSSTTRAPIIPPKDHSRDVYTATGANVSAGSSHYYAAMTRPPPVGSETSALKGVVNEPSIDLKNPTVVPSIPTTTYGGSNYSSYGYGYGQAGTYQQPAVSYQQPSSIQQPAAYQQPAYQQPASVQQPGMYQQPSSVQQAGAYQQPSAVQQAGAYQQPSAVQQAGAYQQPSAVQQAGAYQQPSTVQAGAYQQPSAVQQAGAYQQPSTVQQAGAYQQPSTVQQAGAYKQPSSVQQTTTYQQPSYQQPSSAQQPGTYQQPAAYQQPSSVQQPVAYQQRTSYQPASYQQPNSYAASTAMNYPSASTPYTVTSEGSSGVYQSVMNPSGSTAYSVGATGNQATTQAYSNTAQSYNNTSNQNAYNPAASAYPSGNYESYSQLSVAAQNSPKNYNYNPATTYSSQYPYAGYSNYSATYTNYVSPTSLSNATAYPNYVANANYQYVSPNPAATVASASNTPVATEVPCTTDLNYVSIEASTYNTAHSYTNAGQSNTMNIESTSKSVDGRSYVAQYATPNVDAKSQQYYSNQYGYQYKDLKTIEDTTEKFVPKVNDEGERLQAKRNSMTYMQASSNNNSTTSIYSMNGSNTTATEKNVDLLADLDFQVSDAPLLPVPESAAANQITDKLKDLSVSSSQGGENKMNNGL